MMNYSSLIFIALGLSACIFGAEARLHTEKILGGDLADIKNFRYVVAIFKNKEQICTGAILSDDIILTAAHCVVTDKRQFIKADFSVVAGVADLSTNGGIRRAVEQIYVPKTYVATGGVKASKSDIAVLKLKEGLDIHKHPELATVALPKKTDGHLTYIDKKVVLAGYGYNWVKHVGINEKTLAPVYEKGYNEGKNRLRFGNALVISNSECSKFYPFAVNRVHQICAHMVQRVKGVGEGMCDGDSGGPLVRNGETVIGVAESSPPDCNESRGPGLYTKVFHHIPMIESAMKGEQLSTVDRATYSVNSNGLKVLTVN